MGESEFNARKKQLRGLWKKYKVGLITEDDMTAEEIILLRKYYPIRREGEEGYGDDYIGNEKE